MAIPKYCDGDVVEHTLRHLKVWDPTGLTIHRLALAPDGLSPIGGNPGNDDEGRSMQRTLDQPDLRQDMVSYFKVHLS